MNIRSITPQIRTTDMESTVAFYTEKLGFGKATMDQIRLAISGMQNQVQTLLSERIQEIDSIRIRDYTLVILTLFVGLLVRVVSFYLFDRGIVRRIQRIANYVDSLTQGTEARFTPSQKNDAIGNLEMKIAALSITPKDAPK